MNELRVRPGRGRPHQGYTTVLANSHLGDYARFRPGPGIAMGYDDLKTTGAKKFLVAVTGGERRNSTVADSTWHKVPAVAGTTAARRALYEEGP